jgi:uncharacterized protein
MKESDVRVAGLPPLEWTNGTTKTQYDEGLRELRLEAAAGVDWSNDPLGGPGQHGATLLGFRPDTDFALSARVRVVGQRSTFDASVLGLWCDEDHWAKLCFEYSPGGQAMVVSVVTNGFSDDCNSTIVKNDFTHLRIARSGSAFAFHSSVDGERWDFVRLFRLRRDVGVIAGFMSQAPMGETCDARFDQITWAQSAPADLRDGS